MKNYLSEKLRKKGLWGQGSAVGEKRQQDKTFSSCEPYCIHPFFVYFSTKAYVNQKALLARHALKQESKKENPHHQNKSYAGLARTLKVLEC